MARNLRLKTSVRAPPPTEQRNLCAGTADDAPRMLHRCTYQRRGMGGFAAGTCSTRAASQARADPESWIIREAFKTNQGTAKGSRASHPHQYTVTTRNNKTCSTGSKKPLLPDEWRTTARRSSARIRGRTNRVEGKEERLQSRIWSVMRSVVMDGQVEADKEAIRNEMAGLSEEKVLFPVNCNWNHWCFMVMNLEKGKVVIYRFQFVFLLSECLLRGTDADISTTKRCKTKPMRADVTSRGWAFK
ncbi:hypothetical protein GQ600_15823 [Phytophthora cactorum]|nr:hypothetical protein GQ600_15823 [Phytophthora cactorum]